MPSNREKARIDQQERRRFPSRQRQTPRIFGDPSKIKTTWLGSFDASTL